MASPKTNKKEKIHYIDNNEFTEAMRVWSDDCRKHPKNERPQMTDYIGECIMKIVNRYATKPNFSGYSYIEDMKSEAILTCLKYAHNFNFEKSSNAFAYFTQITHHAFAQVLNKEKAISKMKFQIMKENSPALAKKDYKEELTLGDE